MSPIKNPALHRYWIEFQRQPGRRLEMFWPPLACGVTAYTYEDALRLIERDVYRDIRLPPVVKVIEDVDLSQLDHMWHTNIGVPLWQVHGDASRATPIWRGVWYPFLGYAPR